MTTVTGELIDAYDRQGAVVIRNLLSPEEISLLESAIEENLEHPSPRLKIASRKDDPGSFLEDFRNWQSNNGYRQLIFESKMGMVAGKLMKSTFTRLYHDHLLVKEPGTRQRTPWHQDQPYYNIEGRKNLSMWIPVDPVSRSATLEFIAGSHKGPWLIPRSFLDEQAKWFPEGSLAELPDIEADRERYEILGWEMNPGDVVCFHMLTLHAAGPVESDTRRRTFTVRFIGDDITHAPRQWKTSPDFPELEGVLPSGADLDHPVFPVIWRDEPDTGL